MTLSESGTFRPSLREPQKVCLFLLAFLRLGLYGEGGGGCGFRGTAQRGGEPLAHPSHAPALLAPSPAPGQMETRRRMFMETVNGLAAPSQWEAALPACLEAAG